MPVTFQAALEAHTKRKEAAAQALENAIKEHIETIDKWLLGYYIPGQQLQVELSELLTEDGKKRLHADYADWQLGFKTIENEDGRDCHLVTLNSKSRPRSV